MDVGQIRTVFSADISQLGAAVKTAEALVQKYSQNAAAGSQMVANKAALLTGILDETVKEFKKLDAEAGKAFSGASQAASNGARAIGAFETAAGKAAISQRHLGSAVGIVASQVGGLGPIANLAGNAITTMAFASGPAGIALGGLAAVVGFLIYRLEQARERFRELSEIELAGIARETKALQLEQQIRSQIRTLQSFNPRDSGSERLAETRERMTQLRIEAEKLGVSATKINELERLSIGKVLGERAEETRKKIESVTQSIEKQITGLKGQLIALEEGAAAGDRYAKTQQAMAEIGAKLPRTIEAAIEKQVALQQVINMMQHNKGLDSQLASLEAQSVAFRDGDQAAQKFLLTQQAMAQLGNLLTASTIRRIDSIVEETEAIRRRNLAMQDAVKAVQDMEENGKATEAASKAWLAVERELAGLNLTPLQAELANVADRYRDIRQRALAAAMAAGQVVNFEQIDKAQQLAEALVRGREGFEVFDKLWGGLERGASETLNGIMQNSASLGEGMKNIARNMLMSFNEELLRVAALNPLKNILLDMLGVKGPRATSLFDILAGAGAGAGPQQLSGPPPVPVPGAGDWFKSINESITKGLSTVTSLASTGFSSFFSSLGSMLSQGLSSLGGFLSSIISSIGSGIGGFFSAQQGGYVTASKMSGPLPQFASAGPITSNLPAMRYGIGLHNVARMNSEARMPAMESLRGGAVGNAARNPTIINVTLDFDGAIDPRGMKTTPQETRQHIADGIDTSYSFRQKIKLATTG